MEVDSEGDAPPPLQPSSSSALPPQDIHPALRALNQLLYAASSHFLLCALDANPLMTEWIGENLDRKPPPSWARADEIPDEDSVLRIRAFATNLQKMIRMVYPALGNGADAPAPLLSHQSSTPFAPTSSTRSKDIEHTDDDDDVNDENGEGKTIEEEQAIMIHDLHEAIKKMQAEHEADREGDKLLHSRQLRMERTQSAAAEAAHAMQLMRKEGSSSILATSGSSTNFMQHQAELLEVVKQRNAHKAAMELAQRELLLANEQLLAKTAKIDELERTADALEVAFKAMQSIHDNLKATSETALVTATLQSEGRITEANRRLAFQSDWLLTATTSIKSLERAHREEVAKLNEMHDKACAEMKSKIDQLLADRAGLIDDMVKLRDDRNKLSLLVSESLSHLSSQQASFAESIRGGKRSLVINVPAPSRSSSAQEGAPLPLRINSLLRSSDEKFSASFLAQEISKIPLLVVQGRAKKRQLISEAATATSNQRNDSTSPRSVRPPSATSSSYTRSDQYGSEQKRPPRPPSAQRPS